MAIPDFDQLLGQPTLPFADPALGRDDLFILFATHTAAKLASSKGKKPLKTFQPIKTRVEHTSRMCAILVQAAEESLTGSGYQSALSRSCLKRAYKAWLVEYQKQLPYDVPRLSSLWSLVRDVAKMMLPAVEAESKKKTSINHQYTVKATESRYIKGTSYIEFHGYPYPRPENM